MTSSKILQIKELRDQLLAKIAPLQKQIKDAQQEIYGFQSQVAAYDKCLEIIGEMPEEKKVRQRQPTKAFIISTLEAQAANGATVNEILDIAGKQGHVLKRDTVSSLVSRFKTDGIVGHENGRYYMIQYMVKHPPVYDTPPTARPTPLPTANVTSQLDEILS